jgi:hypothetical protein
MEVRPCAMAVARTKLDIIAGYVGMAIGAVVEKNLL